MRITKFSIIGLILIISLVAIIPTSTADSNIQETTASVYVTGGEPLPVDVKLSWLDTIKSWWLSPTKDSSPPYNPLATNISSCGTISSPGQYVLNTSLSNGTVQCIDIDADDVELDCAGFSISGNATPMGASYDAIYIAGQNNITVKNCVIDLGWTVGIHMYVGNTNITLYNNSFTGNYTQGIRSNQVASSNIYVDSNTFDTMLGDAVRLELVDGEVNITNNYVNDIDGFLYAYSGEGPWYIANNTLNNSGGIATRDENMIIEYNTIYNSSYGVLSSNSDNVTIRHNYMYNTSLGIHNWFNNYNFEIWNNTLDGANNTGSFRYGMWLQGSPSSYTLTNHSVYNNTLTNWEDGGIVLWSGDYVDVYNNYMCDNGYGLTVAAYSGARARQLNITNNTICNSVFHGIGASRLDNSTFDLNTINNSGFYGTVFSDADNISVTNTTISYSIDDSLFIAGATSNFTVRYNTLWNGTEGLSFQASDSMIANNTLYNNTLGGIVTYITPDNVTIENNTIYDNGGYGIRLQSGTTNSLVWNNYIENSGVLATDSGTGNDWNITRQAGTNIIGTNYLGGNYYEDYPGYLTYLVSGSAGSIDYWPLMTDDDGDGFGAAIDCDDTNSTIIPLVNNTQIVINESKLICTAPSYYDNASILINGSNLYVDGNGTIVDGPESGSEIFFNSTGFDNITLRNIEIIDYTGYQVYVEDADGFYMNNTIHDGVANPAPTRIINSNNIIIDNYEVFNSSNIQSPNIDNSSNGTLQNFYIASDLGLSSTILLQGNSSNWTIQNGVMNNSDGLRITNGGSNRHRNVTIQNVSFEDVQFVSLDSLSDGLFIDNNVTASSFTIDVGVGGQSENNTLVNNTIRSSLSIQGNNTNITSNEFNNTGITALDTTISISGANNTIFRDNVFATGLNKTVLINLASFTTFINNTFKDETKKDGIVMDNADNVFIINNTIRDYHDTGKAPSTFPSPQYHAIEVGFNMENVTIEGNDFYLNDYDVWIDEGTNNTNISFNVFNSTGDTLLFGQRSGQGIFVNQPAAFGDTENVRIWNNSWGRDFTVSGPRDYIAGVTVYETSGTLIENNTFTFIQSAVLLESLGNGTVVNNNIMNANVSDIGVEINSSSFNNITNNNISAVNFGMYIDPSFNNTIINNTVYNGTGGLLLLDSHNNTLFNNFFLNNSDYGLNITNGTGNLVYNNNFTNNTVNAYDDSNASNDWNTTQQTGPNIIGGQDIGGNFYDDYNGTDDNADGIGDTDLPYNISGGNSTDELPLTNNLTIFPPNVTILSPIPTNQTFDPFDSVNLSANVTDNLNPIDTVIFQITYPNTTAVNVTPTLLNAGYYSLNEPASAGVVNNAFTYYLWGEDSVAGKVNATAIFIATPPNSVIDTAEFNVTLLSGSPATKNFVYDFYMCATALGGLSATTDPSTYCNESTVLVADDFNVSSSFGGSSGLKNVTFGTPFTTVSSKNYVIYWTRVSGGDLGASDNWINGVDTTVTGAWLNRVRGVTSSIALVLPAYTLYATTDPYYYYNWTNTSQLGAYTLQVFANNTAGALNDSETTNWFINDTTAPNITNLTATPNPVERSEGLNLSATITDNFNLTNVNLSVIGDNVEWPIQYFTPTQNGNWWSISFNTDVPPGRYNYTFYATDGSNNTANASAQFDVYFVNSSEIIENITDAIDNISVNITANITTNIINGSREFKGATPAYIPANSGVLTSWSIVTLSGAIVPQVVNNTSSEFQILDVNYSTVILNGTLTCVQARCNNTWNLTNLTAGDYGIKYKIDLEPNVTANLSAETFYYSNLFRVDVTNQSGAGWPTALILTLIALAFLTTLIISRIGDAMNDLIKLVLMGVPMVLAILGANVARQIAEEFVTDVALLSLLDVAYWGMLMMTLTLFGYFMIVIAGRLMKNLVDIWREKYHK